MQSLQPDTLEPLTDDTHRVQRDESFYYATGDCIIRVQQTLFKIHQFQLVDNSPVFASLFTLPVGESKVEGSSDDLPIVLPGDTASDFRSLLTYIYASVIATQIHSVSPSQLPDVIAVARLAHKYEMEAWQNWSILVLDYHFKTFSLSLSDLGTIYRVCYKPQWHTLRTKVSNAWVQRMERQVLLSLGEALNAAELQNDRAFLMRLYTLHFSRTRKVATLANPTPFPTDGIPPIHLNRMLRGHWSLSTAWSNFRSGAPSFPPYLLFCNPDKHGACMRTATAFWDQALANAEREHPIYAMPARLERVRRTLADSVPVPRCFDAFSELGDVIQKIADAFRLEDHFFPKAQ